MFILYFGWGRGGRQDFCQEYCSGILVFCVSNSRTMAVIVPLFQSLMWPYLISCVQLRVPSPYVYI